MSIPDMYINKPVLEEDSKPFWKSWGIVGPIISIASLLLPKYKPIFDVLPEVTSPVGVIVGAIVGAIGRIKAKKKVTLT